MKRITISDIITKQERLQFIKSNFHKNWLDVMIEFPAIFESAKVLRDFIVDIADFFCFKDTWKSRLTIIADELNNNSIEYWSVKDDINRMIIKIIIVWEAVELVLEVEDSWKWIESKTASEMFDIKNARISKWFEKHKSIRGRWLFLIITKLVDELYFKDSKTWWLIVGIRKKIDIEKSKMDIEKTNK